MNEDEMNDLLEQAIATPRHRGGWLVMTHQSAPVRLGAFGATEDEGRAQLRQLVELYVKTRDEARA